MKSKILGKKTKRRIKTALTAVACVTAALLLMFTAACGSVKTFSPPDNTLPAAEKYALQKYGYDELGDVQTTIRADSMHVTERNIARAQAAELSDDFSVVYDAAGKSLYAAYEKVAGTASLKVATINFSKYPSPAKATSANDFAAAAAALGVSANDYYAYYKYMLMTQGQHLALEASRRSAATASDGDGVNAAFAAWLKKHPAADAQYGKVLGENNAVVKEIALDPLYRSPHASGLYLPAGEPITVKVEGLAAGERIGITLGMQNSLAWRGSVPEAADTKIASATGGIGAVDFADSASDAFFKKADLVTALGEFYTYNSGDNTPFLQSQWKRQNARAPWITASFTFTENKTYTVGYAFGGAIHIDMGNCYSRAKVTISGAVETPHYILGSTTPEYFDEYLRQAPGVIAILDTENGQLIGPTGETGTTAYMRQVKTDEIDKLAMLWHSFLSVNESFTGGPYNRFNKVMFDWHVPAGAAVALGNYSFAHPTGWFNGAMNYRGLLSGGTWGILHEIGHNHAASYGTVWGFGGSQEGEVRNNALILLSYIMFCDIGTTIRNGGGAEHGAYANPYSTLDETIRLKGTKSDFNDNGYFQALGMYANIMHSFGAEKYYELLYTYKGKSAYCENKRADFAYRCSLVYGMNFLKYFNEFYAAHITDEMFTDEQLAEIKALPNYEPVASYYAGGADGVKTAGDYCVAFGDPVKFDLKGKTISTLDTADGKGFDIVSVGKPEHGKITSTADGQWQYAFDPKYTGVFDSFTYTVKLSDGVAHTLTVTLRISYNGARVSRYTDVADPSVSGQALVEDLENQIAGKTPEYLSSTSSTLPAYNTGGPEVRTLDFWWRAPVSGYVSLSLAGSGVLALYFGDDFDGLSRTNLLYSGGAAYNNAAYAVRVEEGAHYAVRVLNSNLRRQTSATSVTVGVLQKNGAVVAAATEDEIAALKADGAGYGAIPSAQVFHVSYPLGKPAPSFIYEPEFIVSKKDNVKLSVTGTDKSEWTVLKAPDAAGGRYDKQQLVDPDTGKPIEGEDGVLIVDKWTWLIDGQTGTNLHTVIAGPAISAENPHVFVIDTAKMQQFNYFAVTTRNNVNSYIMDCELKIADSIDATTLAGDWKTIATANRDAYSGTTLTMTFNQTQGRYLMLIVKGGSGNSGKGGANFSVLAEIDAGIKSTTQRVISSASSKLYTTKGWVHSSTVENEPNGYIIAEQKNQKAVVRFRGESFALYAATGSGYGKADVRVDGKHVATIDLDRDTAEARYLAFYTDNLKNKEHTVEIITKNSGKVMLNVLGIPYTAELLNAPNIYMERGLAIALAVFAVLFVVSAAFGLALLFSPSFRNKVFGSKAVQKLDNRKNKSADKTEKPRKNKDGKEKSKEKSDNRGEKKQEPVKPTEKPAPAKTAQVRPMTVKTEPKPAATNSTQPARTAARTRPPAPSAPATTASRRPAVKPDPKKPDSPAKNPRNGK